MSEYNFTDKTLKFVTVNTKKFHENKQYIELINVNVDKIVILGRFKNTHKDFKHFIGYKTDEMVKNLCIVLPQMNAYV